MEEQRHAPTPFDPLVNKNYTSDQLLKKFGSQFELVNYAIRLAENMIRSGKEPHLIGDAQNIALQVIAAIASNTDRFEEITETVVETRFTEMIEPLRQAHKETLRSPVEKKKQRVPL
jgi:DNA-directed RNA polymerase subunit K/omega